MKQLGVREKEGRIPPEQHEAGDLPCLGITGYVVIALYTFDAAKHCRMRTPAIPKELNHCNHDRDGDARNGTEHGHTCEAGHRKPELPALDTIDAA